ncbi:MAG: VTT domain-containing protein [Candidatus Acidiferrales bacterium]
MNESIQFLLRHGYAVLFLAVFAEQVGLPIPAIPILLAMGALVGTGQLDLAPAFLIALSASLLSDIFWYEIGRRRGHKVLNLLCRISLEPDSCVRRTEETFVRRGPRALLIAKFVPGLSTAAPPLAGMFRMRFPHFLAWDAAGAAVWVGAFGGLGWIFSGQLERVAQWALKLGEGLVYLVGVALAGYIAYKYIERQRFIRRLRIARITSLELQRKLEAGENIMVVDLRSSAAFEVEPAKLPGALHMSPEELEQRHLEIPRDREIVLYCT